ncbi:MAG: hypothetical protein ACTSWY_09590 [Promethearchaeota archaeon]
MEFQIKTIGYAPIITPIIIIFPMIIFFLIFLRKALRTHQKMFFHLALFYGISLFHPLFVIGSNINITEEFAKLSFVISEIFHLLSLFFLLLIMEVFEKNKVFSGTQIFLTIIMDLAIGAMVSNPNNIELSRSNDYFTIEFQIYSFANIFLSIFSFSAIFRLILIFFKSKRSVKKPEQKKFIIWLFFGIFLSQIVSILPRLVQLIGEEITRMSVGMGVMGVNSLGMIIVGVLFYKIGKNPWLLQRQRVHFLLIFSKNGLVLYTKTFTKDISEDEITLLTGGLSAITSMFDEIIKFQDSIEAIIWRGRELRIINKEHFLCAILEEYTTQASEIAHKNFTEEFAELFSEQLINFKGNISGFQSTGQIIEKYFF